jgi:hypothetical protein
MFMVVKWHRRRRAWKESEKEKTKTNETPAPESRKGQTPEANSTKTPTG